MNNIQRALLSVSDKTGVLELAKQLAKLGVELLSTGGTAKLLREAGLTVKDVSEHTGFPEMMAGRIKTLHPKVHGGLLGRRGIDEAIMAQHDISPIDLVVVNLYPFEATVARDDCTLEMAIENIDIGGPTMLRAAAKNHAAVTVLIDPADYSRVITQIESSGGVNDATRFDLALISELLPGFLQLLYSFLDMAFISHLVPHLAYPADVNDCRIEFRPTIVAWDIRLSFFCGSHANLVQVRFG